MTGIYITCAVLFVALVMLLRAVARDEKAKRAEWRPNGYTCETGNDWWHQPLPAVGLRQSVRVIDAPPAAELVSVADPRIVRSSRFIAPDRKARRVERVRRIEKRRASARGAA